MTKQKHSVDPEHGENPAPEFSILIGLVSTEDKVRLLETLASLRNQHGGCTYEVIIADRRDDAESAVVRARFPEVQMITADASISLPELRTMALDRSRGDYIVVTEDHCVPAHDWLRNISQAFAVAPDSTVAVGGCVENGVCDSALDWATFLCEYSYFLEPVAEGVTEVLPGMNVAYRRTVFDGLERSLLTEGFWETTLHPLLIASGRTLYSTNKIRIYHCKKFSLRLFLSQRFIYSRYFAGLRVQTRSLFYRIALSAASLVLPGLLIYRMVKQVRAKQRPHRELLSALPYLGLFVIVWAIGEMVGYLRGTGDALAKIE